MQNKLKKYAELKLEITRLTEELKEIYDDVFQEVVKFEGERIDTDLGEFKIINGRKKWKYSDQLVEKERVVKESIKLKKKEEELKGIAVQEDSPSTLVFKAKKQ